MALSVCSRLAGVSAVFSRLAASTPRGPSSLLLSAGNSACSGGRTSSLFFSPACFITSEAFLNRLGRGGVVEADGSYECNPASLPLDSDQQKALLLRTPDQPDNSKLLRVAIIGAPNAGKSTLSNQLLGKKVFAMSKKVHTTQSRALGVFTKDNTQIILLDTPGLTTPSKVKRHNLEKSLLVDPWISLREADLMVIVVDVADRRACRKLDVEVLKCLAQHPNIPAILVLNKVDLVKAKDNLLEFTQNLTQGVVNNRKTLVRRVIKRAERPKRESELLLDEDDTGPEGGAEPSLVQSKEQPKNLVSQSGWPHFKDVFMLSSLDREDVEVLKSYFIKAAKPGLWQYHSKVLTDQNPEEVCTNIIREKLLEYLPQEVPYSLTQFIEVWEEGEKGELNISVRLYANKSTHVMVIGPAGQMVSRITQEASEDLSRVFLKEVKLYLTVKLRKEARD
ncbi:GTPase Era, mitochondrial isoform 2-T2 [Aulostomus maculatus]